MSKKNFSDNPALRFISGDQPQTEPKQNKGTYKRKNTDVDFEKRLDELRELLPEGKSLEVKSEPRTERLQLVLPPTLRKQLREAAEREGISVNEFAIRALETRIDNMEE